MPPPARRCVCQQANPDSPLPPGSDGCPVRPAAVIRPDPAELPLSTIVEAMQSDGPAEPPLVQLIAPDAARTLVDGRALLALPAAAPINPMIQLLLRSKEMSE